ncbi:MAG: GNAT family N-acetyltransferase [Acidobacteriota bacterium]
MHMKIETQRLILRRFTTDDAEFVIDLLNQPSFLRFIGDRGVRTPEDARRFLTRGPIASYEKNGFGLYKVELQESGEAIGMCGLLRREGLEDPDIGFAFLPQFWSQGYAFEAASAVMAHARASLGLERIVAIASPDNDRSFKLLEKLGLRYERMVRLAEGQPEIKLFTPASESDHI